MTRTCKPYVSETDVFSKKMKIQKNLHRYLTKPDKIARSYKGGRYALTAQCGLFRNDGWRYCRGSGASLRNVVGRHTDATQFIELHTIMLQPVHSVGANIHIERCSSHTASFLRCSVFPFLVVTMSLWCFECYFTSIQKLCVGDSIGS